MAKQKKMYVIDSSDHNGEFVHSIWCGEGYATKREAMQHIKYFKEHNLFTKEKLSVITEDPPAGW